MAGDIALRIRFDEEVKVADILIRRYWSVGADNFLGFAIDWKCSSNGHVLANWKTKDLGGAM